MVTIDRVAAMGAAADGLRRDGRTIGFVPTMGALHEGHLSLMRLARTRADSVVVSVFVNPAQFGPGEDFDAYPRDPARDSALAADAGADILFMPSAVEMYPPGHSTTVEPGRIAAVLEGKSRPGHFRGVATVVARLFNIVKPHVAVFGQKDAQQVVVVRRMAADLGFGVDIVVGPTVREPDGLAMSSRNAYLGPGERPQAAVLRRSLDAALRLAAGGERDCGAITRAMRAVIASAPDAVVDYISVADPDTLEEIEELGELPGGTRALVSLAVRIGKTRLIDNDFVHVN
jgi:pantoate--beta-alanine ligase